MLDFGRDPNYNRRFAFVRRSWYQHALLPPSTCHRAIRSVERAPIRVEAVVAEVLPNALFRLALADGRLVTAHAADELRMHVVRVLPGDAVTVEISRYDESRGRIILRR